MTATLGSRVADGARRCPAISTAALMPSADSLNDYPREALMRIKLTALLAAGTLVGFAGSVLAHHSFAMFDQEHPVELVGKVKEFKFTSPHTFILLEVKDGDESVVWNLEGQAPGGLARDGWGPKTLPPGTELKMKIDPLRSGAPGPSRGPHSRTAVRSSLVISVIAHSATLGTVGRVHPGLRS
jgi:Family of unknown function (DUF6152)